MVYSKKNANYDFADQHKPKKKMGEGQYANMPSQPIMKKFDDRCEYRDGIINRFEAGVSDLSGIAENHK